MAEERDPLEDRDADVAEVERKRLLESMEEDAQVAKLASLLQNEDVRDFLWQMLIRGHMDHSIWEANYGRMSLLEGERNMALWLKAQICVADPNAYLQMELKAAKVAQAKQQSEASKRARRARSRAANP